MSQADDDLCYHLIIGHHENTILLIKTIREVMKTNLSAAMKCNADRLVVVRDEKTLDELVQKLEKIGVSTQLSLGKCTSYPKQPTF